MFSAILLKGDNISGFMFALLAGEALQKGSTFEAKNLLPFQQGGKFFPLRRPHSERRRNMKMEELLPL